MQLQVTKEVIAVVPVDYVFCVVLSNVPFDKLRLFLLLTRRNKQAKFIGAFQTAWIKKGPKQYSRDLLQSRFPRMQN